MLTSLSWWLEGMRAEDMVSRANNSQGMGRQIFGSGKEMEGSSKFSSMMCELSILTQSWHLKPYGVSSVLLTPLKVPHQASFDCQRESDHIKSPERATASEDLVRSLEIPGVERDKPLRETALRCFPLHLQKPPRGQNAGDVYPQSLQTLTSGTDVDHSRRFTHRHTPLWHALRNNNPRRKVASFPNRLAR